MHAQKDQTWYLSEYEYEGIHPDTIAKYYGVNGRVHQAPSETGAGNPPNERADGLSETSNSLILNMRLFLFLATLILSRII